MKVRKIVIRVALVLALGGLALAGGISSSAAPAGGASKEIRILYLPALGQAATLAKFKPLTDHVGKALNLPMKAICPDNYNQVLVLLAQGQFEVAYLGPLTYVEAEPISRLEVAVMELDTAGNRGYRSIMISRADRGFQKVEDARGKVLAFTDVRSASGFLIPLAYFIKELKTTPQAFASKVIFAGDHQAVIKGILQGQYDLGATNDMDLNRILETEKIPPSRIRLVWKSELYPGPPVCLRQDLTPALKNALKKALLDFNRNPEGLRALQIGGFAPATRKDYEKVRVLLALKP